MRIWKWELAITDTQFIRLPKGAQILSVQTQRGGPCLWALVDETAPTEERTIATYGTGNPLPDKDSFGDFVGTYQMADGAIVFHVFDQSPSAHFRK